MLEEEKRGEKYENQMAGVRRSENLSHSFVPEASCINETSAMGVSTYHFECFIFL